ncbi:OB-fold protein [Alistipes putredinis]|jgi:hypothetical protein|uniref:OB-fold protein n=1 Tax=Alistipes putredinis TaxID=28117 RepID=UPI00242F0121|nr:hypothetical protein [Alistipes putredinis]
MKKILPIIGLAWLLLSCNSEQKYRQLAEEFLKDIPSERVIATFTDVDRHCIFYIKEAEFDEGKTFLVEGDAGGDKYHNIIKYDLKTKEYSRILRNDNTELTAGLEDAAEFAVIDHFEANSNFILIASTIRYAHLFGRYSYDKLALYNVDENRWHYLGGFPSSDIQMTEERIWCRSEYFPFVYSDYFGPLKWVKVFDMNGDCIENYVYDELSQKSYDAHRLIENEDVDYANELFGENFESYMKGITYSADNLIEEHSKNPVVFDNTYDGQEMLILGIVADLVRDEERDWKWMLIDWVTVTHYYYYIELRGEDHFFDTLTFKVESEDELAKVNKGEGAFIRAKYKDGRFVDCKVVDQKIWEEYMEQYKEYLRQQRGDSL